ncbi:MAG: hypothetical protein ACFFBP_00500 [Promethearchaeota archaeon]
MFPDIKLDNKIRNNKDFMAEIQMHIDFDKNEKVLYNNLYFKGCKYVLKMPIYSIKNECLFNECKIERFKFNNQVFFLHY